MFAWNIKISSQASREKYHSDMDHFGKYLTGVIIPPVYVYSIILNL